ncbi:hypothetical protein GS506_03650 [Rhodococcus hoagii]|nr:hypothetical protein [Prescottella equi]
MVAGSSPARPTQAGAEFVAKVGYLSPGARPRSLARAPRAPFPPRSHA